MIQLVLINVAANQNILRAKSKYPDALSGTVRPAKQRPFIHLCAIGQLTVAAHAIGCGDRDTYSALLQAPHRRRVSALRCAALAAP
jgi:hypothetical protein